MAMHVKAWRFVYARGTLDVRGRKDQLTILAFGRLGTDLLVVLLQGCKILASCTENRIVIETLLLRGCIPCPETSTLKYEWRKTPVQPYFNEQTVQRFERLIEYCMNDVSQMFAGLH